MAQRTNSEGRKKQRGKITRKVTCTFGHDDTGELENVPTVRDLGDLSVSGSRLKISTEFCFQSWVSLKLNIIQFGNQT